MDESFSPEPFPANLDNPPAFWVRIIVYGATWLPFAWGLLFVLPHFDPIFVKLEEQGELPALTHWIVWFGRLNRDFFAVPLLFGFSLLISADMGLADWSQSRPGRTRVFRVWFPSTAVWGIVAFLLLMLGILSPVVRMSSLAK